jgi:hypothetical protein
MATVASNKIKFLLVNKIVSFASGGDVFKIILMQSGFTFNKDTHHAYADVSTSELATANGYTAGGATLAGVVVTEDDTDDRTEITWNNAVWSIVTAAVTASGAIIYDDTVAAPTVDPIVGYIDFGGDQTCAVGGTFTIANIEVRVA